MTNIRLATAQDRDAAIDLVRRLLTELGGTPAPAEAMAPVFGRFADDGPSGFVALAEDDGRFVAVCTVSFVDALRSVGRYAIIQEMYVDPIVRSSGVGMDVLRFVLDHAVARGCAMVELGTPFHGERQIQFYERAGFTDLILDPVEDAYRPRRANASPDDDPTRLSLYIIRGRRS